VHGNYVVFKFLQVKLRVYTIANAPGLTYFHDGFVEGFIMVGITVSTGLGIILYHASPNRYIMGANKLQMI